MTQEEEIARLRQELRSMNLPPPQELRRPPAEALAALQQDIDAMMQYTNGDRRQALRRTEDLVRVRR